MSIFHDKEFVYDIKKSDHPIKIATDAGSRIVSKQAMVAGFGRVWYDEGAITNIFSIQDLKKQHHIRYDSEVEDAFLVQKRRYRTCEVQVYRSGYLCLYYPSMS